MIQVTPETLATAATSLLLPLDEPPSEAAIEEVLASLATGFRADAATVDECRRLLHSRFAIRMSLGETLLSDEWHEPWIDGRRAAIDPYYWKRYRELLLGRGWSPLVVGSLDRATDKLLDLLGNPECAGPWARRGLVMGEVQSGKTAAYTGLVCKAADAGYRLIILLTGTLESVRRQTQGRLDEGFVGFDSREFLNDARARHKRHLGVGLLDSQRDGIVFTSHGTDFRKNVASALNISLASVSEPVLVVTKKNKVVLQRLLAWLRARNADRDGLIEVPVLIVDDEADNASVNTKADPSSATAINQSIRELLGLFRRRSYVGFTATPFANIFIDPQSSDAMLGDDLFPRDFIHVLDPATNYTGVQQYFGADSAGDDVECSVIAAGDPVLRVIDDEEAWLPIRHKLTDVPGVLPDSFRAALHSFLLATAIRDLRRSRRTHVGDGTQHRSMLVNVSRFTEVQLLVADQVRFELEAVRNAVRLHGALGPRDAARAPIIAWLEECFLREFAGCGLEWPEVLAQLHDAIAPISVQAVNQRTGTGALDYSKTSATGGLRVIAVGGNSLSRGITLEGLSTSYFMRNAHAYDTLLQMGRWFGFRDGYGDLCRLWLPEEIAASYRHVAAAVAELKADFRRMERRKATPREFGLRVRSHPGTLLITARNKMATGLDMDLSWGVSVYGRLIESTRLFSDERRNSENRRRCEAFMVQLRRSGHVPAHSPHGGAIVWDGVPASAVADFLEEFLVHPFNYDFQGEAIASFLRRQEGAVDTRLAEWRVVLPVDGRADERPLTVDALPGVLVRPSRRRVKVDAESQSLLVSGKGARVGGRSDLRHGFAPVRYRELNVAGATEEGLRAELAAPLLTMFMLVGVERGDGGARERTFRSGLVLPAISMHFPGTAAPDVPSNLVRYRLNLVAQRALVPMEVEEAEIGDDGDSDD